MKSCATVRPHLSLPLSQMSLIVLSIFGFLLTNCTAIAGSISEWHASSGLLPNEIHPMWDAFLANPDTADLSGGVLTLSTSAHSELAFYGHIEPLVNTSEPFFIEVRLRYVSGQTSNTARAPIVLGLIFAPSMGQLLQIDKDQVFFNTGGLVAGQKVNVDTDDDFHTYRIEYDGIDEQRLSYDGEEILIGKTWSSAGNGNQQRVFWGDGTSLASGTSEWQFVRHNALVNLPGDFNNDYQLNCDDIDLIRNAVINMTSDPIFNVDGIGGDAPDIDDFTFYITDASMQGTGFGDGDLNKLVNFNDFVLLSAPF